MLIFSRLAVITNTDDDHCKILMQRRAKADRKCDALRNYNLIPIGSTAAVEREYTGLWSHGTIVEKGDKKQND